MTTQQDREELIAFVKANACGGSYFNLQMERVAALLAEDGKAGGEVVATLHDDGHFTWKSNDLRMKHGSNFAGWRMDVYTHPQPAQVAHPLTEERVLEMSRVNYWHNSITTLRAYTEGVRDAESAHNIK